MIFPIVRRQSEELALGYVTARIFECTFILIGIVAVLGIVTLQQEVAGAAEASIAYTLAAIKDWTFWLGPGWVVGWGNGLILGYLMFSSELVPRKMAMLGLVGGPLIIVSGTLVMFGVADPGDDVAVADRTASSGERAGEQCCDGALGASDPRVEHAENLPFGHDATGVATGISLSRNPTRYVAGSWPRGIGSTSWRWSSLWIAPRDRRFSRNDSETLSSIGESRA